MRSEPAAATASPFASGENGPAVNGLAEEVPVTRNVLVTGHRRLYLEALCEFFDCIPRLSTTLVGPEEGATGWADLSPDVILVGCPAVAGGVTALVGSLADAFPGVPLVLFDQGPTRGTGAATVPGTAGSKVVAHLNSGVPLRQLAAVLSGSSNSGSDSQRRTGPRLVAGGDWRLAALSDREISVLRLVIAGRRNDEVGQELGISHHTVRTHVQNIMAKMLVRSRAELVSVAMRSGIRPDSLAHRH